MEGFFNISGFECGYKSGFSIHDISFAISKGSFTGIVGPNGSGKTTLFRGIAGELKKTSGTIELNGIDLHSLKQKEKAQKLAVVTQDNEAAFMSVEEYVLLGRLPYRENMRLFETKADYAIARKYMELTHTWAIKDMQLSQLSGGQLQLAAIARALAQEPELLLLDEPTAHLDISNQVQIMNLIHLLNKGLGLTVLMIIHDLNLAGEFCDSLILMENGAICKKGTPADVLVFNDIENVYNTVVVSGENPVSGNPVIYLISERALKEREK